MHNPKMEEKGRSSSSSCTTLVDDARETSPLLYKGRDEKLSVKHLGQPDFKGEALEILSMAVQLGLAGAMRLAQSTTDSAFLGHVGTKELAGAALAQMYMGIPNNFVYSGLNALYTLSSQAYGAGNKELQGIWLQLGIVYTITFSIPVIIWYFIVGHLLHLFMADEATCSYGNTFACIMAFGVIPQNLYTCLRIFFSTQGVIRPATIISSIGVVLNVFFNYFFIYGAFGFAGLGFIGSPIATVVSQTVQPILFIAYAIVWKKLHRDSWFGWTWGCLESSRVKTFLHLSFPMAMSSLVDTATGSVTGAFSAMLGPNIAACESVLMGLFMVTYCGFLGFSAATQIRVSRFLGAGDAAAAQKVLGVGSGLCLVAAISVLIVVVIMRDHLFRVWSSDPVILRMCRDVTFVFCLAFLTSAMRFVYSAVMNGLGKVRMNFWINNIGGWLVYVPLSYILGISFEMALAGFWWADIAGEAVKAGLLMYCILRTDWDDAARTAQKNAEASGEEVGDEFDRASVCRSSASLGTTPTGPFPVPSSPSPFPVTGQRDSEWILNSANKEEMKRASRTNSCKDDRQTFANL